MTVPDRDTLDTFLDAMAPSHTDIQREMADRAAEEGFPIIGRAAGAVLRQLAATTKAAHIFEFGSGFGYSASWFAPAMADDGMIVLTEEDADELALAEGYLERAGYAHLTRFEAGDALETVERYDGPFDVVLIDAHKEQYVDAYDLVREKVPPGGVIVADNALTAGEMDTAEIVRAVVEGDDSPDLDPMGDGIRRYLQHITDDPAFVTSVLPVGSGLALSVRHR